MTREQIRDEINARPLTDFMQIAKATGGGLICPFCGSGEHKNKTGAFSMYKEAGKHKVKCHSCGESQDTLGALRILWECPTETDAMQKAGYNPEGGNMTGHTQARPRLTMPPPKAAERQESPAADMTGYYARCRSELQSSKEAQDYLTRRGISAETVKAFGIGYDAEARRIVIPCGAAFYVARAIDASIKARYMNPKGAASALFNENALHGGGSVFVTEGAFDALSIIQAGGNALAINSTSNAHKVIDALKRARPDGLQILLALDNDAQGVKTRESMLQALRELGVNARPVDVAKPYKDANEALQKAPDEFKKAVQTLADEEGKAARQPDSVLSYLGGGFLHADLQAFRAAAAIPTGFKQLDANLNGGLFPGLYALGAVPSLGKTTLALQIADNVAKNADVIFFSLEMSKAELISKSVARTSAEMRGTGGAFTSLDFRRGIYRDAETRQKAKDALTEYAKQAGRLSLVSWDFCAKLSDIADYVRDYVQRMNARPVVFIDYLQIIRPEDARQTAKEATDAIITGLKRLSRETNTCIFVISSLNRQNYSQSISYESFKESGGIEYTCDFIAGIQLDQQAPKGETESERRERIDEAKRQNPRKILLVCLKNRYGQLFKPMPFDYFTHCDLFMEREQKARTGERI